MLRWKSGDCVVWRISEGTDARPGIDSADRCSIKTCYGSFKIQLGRRGQRKKNRRQDSLQSLNVNQHCNHEEGCLKPTTAQQGRMHVERCGGKSKCAQVYSHACAWVWADQCRLGLFWFAVETLKYEYTGINQVKPSVFFALAQCERNQIKVWKSEWWKNATATPCCKWFGLESS